VCLIGCIALAFPRIALGLVWLFGGNYLSRPFGNWLWPLLGFLFLPLTTITFAFAFNSLGTPGAVSPFGWLLTVIALLADLGLIGSSRTQWQRRQSEQ